MLSLAKEIFANSNSKKKKKDEDELFYRVASYARQKALMESRGEKPLASTKEPVGKTPTKPTVSSTVGKQTTYTERAKQAGQKTIRANTMTEAEKQATRAQYEAEKDELAKQRLDVQRKTVAMKRSGGLSGIDGKELEAERKRIEARMAELDNLLKDVDKPEYVSRIDELGEIVQDAPSKQKQIADEFGIINPRRDPAQFRLYHAALAAANAEKRDAQTELDWIEYVNKYNGKTYTEIEDADSFGDYWKNFWQQGGANKTLGRIGQDTNKAFGTYASSNKQVDEDYAKALAEVEGNFIDRNAAVLDEEGQVLPWLSKTAAGYLPQLGDQIKAGAIGAIPGAVAGFFAGNPIQGARIGASAGTAVESFNLMRGAAFRELLNAGVDEETARAASLDEGFISALIEGGSTYASLGLMGVGKAASAFGNAATTAVANGSKSAALKTIANIFGKATTKTAAKAAAKTATTAATKSFWATVGKVGKGAALYGLNAAQEMGEEGLQKGVSIANMNRAKDGETGAGNLLWETMKTFGNVIVGKDSESASAIWEDAKEGGKIALMFGGATMATNAAITSRMNKAAATSIGKRNQPLAGTIIEQGLSYDTDTTAYKIASKLKGTENVSDVDLGRLVLANELAQADSVIRGYKTNAEALTALIEEGKGYGGIAQKTAEKLEQKVKSGKEVTTAEIERLIAVNTVYFDSETHTVDTASPVAETSVEAPVQSRMQTISARLAESGMETAQSEVVAQSIDRILSGDPTVTGKDKDVLSVGNKAARDIFEEETGVKLPNTNASTRKAISEYIAQTAMSQQRQEVAAPDVITQEATETAPDTAPAVDSTNGETILRQASQSVVTAQAKADMDSYIDMESLGEKGRATFQKLVSKAPHIEQFSNAFQRYYELGHLGMEFEGVTTAYDHGISRAALYEAYAAGQNDASAVVKDNPSTQKKVDKKGKKTPSKGKGKFYDYRTSEGKAASDGKTVTEDIINALERVAKVFNIDIVLEDSIDSKTQKSAANGQYIPGERKIRLAADSQNPLMTVLKHEITHHIQQTSPAQYKAFKDYVMKTLFNNSQDAFEYEIKARIDNAKDNGFKLTRSEAMDEIVADATESFLTDRDSIDALVKENRSLGETILNAIRDVLRKIEAAMKGEKIGTGGWWLEADQLKQAEKMWVEALESASHSEIGVNDVVISESSAPIWSLKSMKFDLLDGQMQRDLVEHGILTVEETNHLMAEISKLIDKMSPFAHIVDMNEEYSKDNRPFAVYKPNSDPLYKVSLDFSTLCKKRLMTQFVMESLQTKLGKALSAKEQMAIRSKLEEYGKVNEQIQVACALCYVEARRLKAPDQINRFLDDRTTILTDYFGKKNKEYKQKVEDMASKMKVKLGYKADTKLKDMKPSDKKKVNEAKQKMMKEYTPTAEEQEIIARANALDNAEFLSQDGLTRLNINEPAIYDAFVSHVRNATKSKALEGGVPYYYGDSKSVSDSLIEAMNAENGLRHQSWSDFEVIHLLDTIAAVIDLSVRKAKVQSYTKVPAFVHVNGNTGMMINLSLIPAGKNGMKDGKLAFSSTEGMDYGVAVELRDQYHKTTGTIAIGIDDKQIGMLLDDPTIDYVIPYHTSGMNAQLRKMAGIAGWLDYESYQSEKEIKGAKQGDCPDALWHKKPDFSEWFDTSKLDMSKSGVEIMREAAGRYLVMCEERGLAPKFSNTKQHTDFSKHENYWKLLIDRKMVDGDGNIIIQQAVRPNFDFNKISEVVDTEVKNYDPTLLDSINEMIMEEWENGGIKQREAELLKEEKAKKKAEKKAAKVQNGLLAQAVAPEKAQKNTTDGGVQHSLKGYTADGTEVYETSKETLKLPWKQRKKLFQDLMSNQYRGRTAKFYNARTGEYDYATFTDDDLGKAIYGNKKSDDAGRDAFVNTGADGSVFDLVENAKYDRPGKEKGKKTKPHKNVTGWDYYVKTVQIDGMVFDMVINVRERPDGKFVYSVQLNENKNKAPAPILVRAYNHESEMAGHESGSHTNASNERVPHPDDSVKGKLSLKDSDYLAAVERGDMETAQKMVDEAAKAAGYTEEVFHGMGGRYNTYKSGNGQYGSGVYFTYAESVGRSYGEVVDHLFVKVGKIADYDDAYKALGKRDDQTLDEFAQVLGFHSFDEMIEDWDNDPTDIASNTELMDILKSKGFEGFVDEGNDGFVLWDFDGIEYRIKLADPVTYDDDGNVIPLSERFNSENEDIRYSLKDSTGKTLSKGQQEFFKDSKTRDAEGRLLRLYHGSKSQLFTEFDMYQGVWLTPDQRYAEVYADQWHSWRDDFDVDRPMMLDEADIYADPDYRLYEVYANITKPLDIGEINEPLEAKDVRRIASALGVNVSDLKAIADDYMDQFIYEMTRSPEFIELARKQHFDGFKATEKGRETWCAIQSADQVKKVDNTDPTSDPDIRYQLKTPPELLEISKQIAEEQHKAKAVTDADIMSKAIKDLNLTGVERDIVKNYQDAMKKLADYEKELAVYDATKGEHPKGRSIYTDASGKVKKSGVKYSAAEKAEIQQKVNWWRNRLKEIEQKEAFQKVLKREKAKMAETHAKKMSDLRDAYNKRLSTLRDQRDAKVEAEKQKMRDYKQHQRDSKAYKELKAKLEADVKWLGDRLVHPTDAKHIPEDFKKVVATFLESLDFTTKGMDKNIAKTGNPSKKYINMWSMIEAYQKIAQDDSSNIVLTPIEEEMLKSLKASFENGRRVEDLDYDELNMVYNIIRWIKAGVANANKTVNEKIKETISEMGDATTKELRGKKAKKEYAGLVAEADKLLGYDNITPADMFHRFGGTLEKLYGEIRNGFNKHIENVRTAIYEVSKITDGHEENIKKWSGKKAKATKFSISDGTTIELTPAQVMSLYVLMKREQAVGHVLGSGIVPSDVVVSESKKVGKGKITLNTTKKITAERASQVTIEDIAKIVETLNEDQKRIADGIVKLFTTKCADWGNETSMKLYGYKKFVEKNYFPIKSSDAYLNARFDDGGDVLIKNLGMTKNTIVNANNPIVVEDIFDVLTDHVNKMSMYNALVAPLTDFTRVYNSKTRDADGIITDSVQKALEAAHGRQALTYVHQFIKDVNKQANTIAAESLANKALTTFKKAKVGANLRVLVQQPTAIVRAADMVDPKYILAGLKQKANYEELFENSEIAYWKSLGFFETDTARSMKDILMGNDKWLDKATMDMYGKADDFAWGHLWNAIKLEQADAHPDMDTTSSEFMDLVKARFEAVVDRTQVVDSVFHRSQLMRNKSVFTKMLTAFMSEPTKTYNMLVTDISDAINTGDKKAKSKIITRSVGTFVASQIVTSMFSAIIDALRDDEDEDKEGNKRSGFRKYVEAVGKNIVDNIIPMNLVPYLRDVVSVFSGYDVKRTDMDTLSKFLKVAQKWLSGKHSYTYLIKETAASFAEIFGIPVQNALRDLDAIVRSTANLFGGLGYAEYWLEKRRYDITHPDNRSKFYKHYTDAVLAGNEDAANHMLMDMVLNGIPKDNIIAKGYQAEKKVTFAKAKKLISKGKTDEAKDIVRDLAKKYDKKYTTLWKSVNAEEPEETYDFKDLKKAFRRGKDTDEIEDYLVKSGEFSKEAMRDAIKMLTEKYK